MSRRRFLLIAGTSAGALLAEDNARPASSMPGRPDFPVPPGACDCHQHVIGDPARFPMSPERTYTPPTAPLEALVAMHRMLHVERAVLIQPSFYGTDNRCLLHALGQLGPSGRGIAVIDDTTSDASLEAMHAAGIRGVRLNPKSGLGDTAALLARFRNAASRVAGLGWHVESLLPIATAIALTDGLAHLPCPVVLDHFAGYRPGGDAAVEPLIGLFQSGRCFIKLSAPYSAVGVGGDDSRLDGFVQRLVGTRTDRLLWGSDWPHTNGKRQPGTGPETVTPFLAVNDLEQFDQLGRWIPDARARDAVLVHNPAVLFGFPAAQPEQDWRK